MPPSNPKPRTPIPTKTMTRPVSGSPIEWPEVLTLSEAAAYLRVSESEIKSMVGPRGLPGRLVGSEWRFSREALQEWLRSPVVPSSRESLLSLAGSWRGDTQAEEMLREIYQSRGRPMTEGDS